jgi:hypothetical protein
MVNAARKAIVLSISVLHLALVLPSSAASVTCVDSDDRTAVATGPAVPDGHETHEHDDSGDCTHFFLSTFLQVTTNTNQFNSGGGPVSANAAKQARPGPGLAELNSRWSDRCDKIGPLMTQKIASLETSIVIC